MYTAVEGYHGNLIANKVPNRENMRDVDGVSVESIDVMLEVIYSAWEYLFLIRIVCCTRFDFLYHSYVCVSVRIHVHSTGSYKLP